MKFFFQCAGLFLILSAILITLDQIIFGRVLSASFLFCFMISLGVTVIFGWIMETHINHTTHLGEHEQ